jgi:Protein of unknown function (DUF2934)
MSSKPTRGSRARPGAVPIALVAERAYFKAEERGFAPGYELDDWLAAERELAAKPSPPKPKRAKRAPSTSA